MANSNTYITILKNNLGYTFKLNELDDSLEVNGEPITDVIRLKIRTQLRDIGYSRELQAIEEAWTTEALTNIYNPLKEYFFNLPPYSLLNDEPWVIPKLSSYIKDTDNIFQTWFTKFTIGAVAKVVQAGNCNPAQNPMLTMVGSQNLGKSRLARWLCSGISRYFAEGAIKTDDKDYWLRLANKFIWEVGELEGVISKEDKSALKDFITRDKITVRKPYGKYEIEKPAVCSLIGTVNEDGTGFLNDPTGSRRFLTCELISIDWEYSRIDPNLVWAEAYYLYQQNPECYLLSPDEKKLRDEINGRFQQDDLTEDMFFEKYEITNDRTDFVTTLDLIRVLEMNGLDGTKRQKEMKVAQMLRKNGIIKSRQNHNTGARGYRGIKKTI